MKQRFYFAGRGGAVSWGLVFLAAAVVLLIGWIGVRALMQLEWESPVLPGTKITVHPPEAWTVRQDDANTAARSMDIWTTSSSGMGSALLLKFSADKDGKLASQGAVDELVRKENAKFAQYAEGKRVDVVDMKSASGFGAYAVWKLAGFESANKITYFNDYRGRFVTKGIVISFFVQGDSEGTLAPQLEKFIQQGITVE